jgi:hypothetical protein
MLFLRAKAGMRARLPIHLYMTTAIRARIKALDEQFCRTMEMLTQRQLLAGSIKTPELPEPQVVALCITGRILTEAHIRVRGRSDNANQAVSILVLSWCCHILSGCLRSPLGQVLKVQHHRS